MNQIFNFVLLGMVGLQDVIIVLIILALFFIPNYFYLLTIQKTLNEVSVENRKMQPTHVWLALIPLFGLYWNFIIVYRIGDSLKVEFDLRNIKYEEVRPGINIGLAYCILLCCTLIPIPFLRAIILIAGLICWIIYWRKIDSYRIKLNQK